MMADHRKWSELREGMSPDRRARNEAATKAILAELRHDFQIENHGSLVLVRPMTDDAAEHLREHTSDEAQWFGGALVVEPRYVTDLIAHLMDAGFAVFENA